MRAQYRGFDVFCEVSYGQCDRPEDTIIVSAEYVDTGTKLTESEILELESENYSELNHEHENYWYEYIRECV